MVFCIVIKDESTFPLVFSILFGFPFLIQILHHINYFLHDRNAVLEIDHARRRIVYTNLETGITVNFDDIKSITRYQGCINPNPFEPYLLPQHFYHHTTIESKSGELVAFSDFVCSEVGVFYPGKQLKVRAFMNLMGSRNHRSRTAAR